MRDSNHRGAANRGRRLAMVLALATAGGACSSPPPVIPAAPTATPAPPTPTPDPHLTTPVSADDIFRALTAAGLKVVANTAGSGSGGEPLRSISASYLGWPLIISQYRTVRALADATPWKTGTAPAQGEPPIAIAGLNILIAWGPTTGSTPPTPAGTQLAAVQSLIAALDPLLWPLRVRTSVTVAVPGHTPTPTASPAPAPTKSPKPTKTPKPTKKPGKTPKPSPKPTSTKSP